MSSFPKLGGDLRPSPSRPVFSDGHVRGGFIKPPADRIDINETPGQDFHVDYGQREIPAGVTGTMLTPLIEVQAPFGHLDCREGLREFEYRYRIGEAILFDGKFEHRPQVAGSPAGAARVLVSWSIATEDERYRFAIQRVIDSQRPAVSSPGTDSPREGTCGPTHGG